MSLHEHQLETSFTDFTGARQGVRRTVAAACEPTRSAFGEWLVMREVTPEGGRCLGLPIARAEDFTRALRGALLHHADDPPPAVLSGHAPDGRRLERAHAAFLALPDVGSRDAIGVVVGAAVLLPRDIEPEDLQAVLLAAGRWERSGFRLTLGRLGVMQLARVGGASAFGPFDPARWTGPSRCWASVTPVALDQNPGNLLARDPEVAARAVRCAEQTVAHACEHIGLPRPAWVRVTHRSRFAGVPPASSFMPYPRHGSGFKRVCVHAELSFDEPVAGPVVLGVGRYFGVGLCAQLAEYVAPSSIDHPA